MFLQQRFLGPKLEVSYVWVCAGTSYWLTWLNELSSCLQIICTLNNQ